jgi:hypothetical protein
MYYLFDLGVQVGNIIWKSLDLIDLPRRSIAPYLFFGCLRSKPVAHDFRLEIGLYFEHKVVLEMSLPV